MAYRRVLTIQDISCVGQCSLTVALPILSACGLETCILPSAVLSTHTGGFKGFTFRDLTDDIPLIRDHWAKEGIKFDAVYTGYLGSTKQIGYVRQILDTMVADGGIKVVDPAMADNGKLYTGFDDAFVKEMAKLCWEADYLLPNLTEACFISGYEYREQYDEAYIMGLLEKLTELGAKTIVLTGISYKPGTTGIVIYNHGDYQYYRHVKLSKSSHGTGDVYASAFTGALVKGKTPYQAAKVAADYTVRCIKATMGDDSHWYGVKFEKEIPFLVRRIGG